MISWGGEVVIGGRGGEVDNLGGEEERVIGGGIISANRRKRIRYQIR